MLVDFLGRSNIVEVLESATDDVSGATRIVVRVLHDRAWIRMLSDAARAVEGADAFGFETHKVFFARDGNVQYSWLLLCWGDGVVADGVLGEILSRRVATAPAFALGAKAPAKKAPAQPPTAQPARPARAAVADDDDDEPAAMRLPTARATGRRTIRERVLDNGAYERTIALPHMRDDVFAGVDPNETLTIHSDRSTRRPRVIVRGRGEADFSPNTRRDL